MSQTKERSSLGPSGFTNTNELAHKWCLDQINQIREGASPELKDKGKIRLWAYRLEYAQGIALDITDDDNNSKFDYSITILADDTDRYGEEDFSTSDIIVPDLAP